MARSMFSLGMFSFLAAATAVRRRGFAIASPPPTRAAIEISRISRVKTRPRLASVAAFLCLMVAHFEWPDMGVPRQKEFGRRANLRAQPGPCQLFRGYCGDPRLAAIPDFARLV